VIVRGAVLGFCGLMQMFARFSTPNVNIGMHERFYACREEKHEQRLLCGLVRIS